MKKKIFVRGPVLSQSGYGEQARFALRCLRSKEDLFDIYISPINWGQTGWIWEDNEFRRWMDERIAITSDLVAQKQMQPDMSLQITIPNEFQKMCPVNIGYTAGIETTKVAPQWLQKGNEQVDKILVVSTHAKTTFQKTVATAQNSQTGETKPYRLETPVEVVWESTPRAEPEAIPNVDLDFDYNFLMVSQMGHRKNFNNAIRWWVEEFFDQEVGLLVKTNIKCNSVTDFFHTENTLKAILKEFPDRKCKIYLLHGDLSSGNMTWLYNHDKIKSIVNIAHGEGFGLPLFEAAREGLPVITIGWGGQVDFLTHKSKSYFQEVKYTLQPVQPEAVWEGVIQKDSMWAYADQGSYKMTLRKTYKNWDKAKKTAAELQTIIEERFNDENLFKGFVKQIAEHENPDAWLSEIEDIVKEYE